MRYPLCHDIIARNAEVVPCHFQADAANGPPLARLRWQERRHAGAQSFLPSPCGTPCCPADAFVVHQPHKTAASKGQARAQGLNHLYTRLFSRVSTAATLAGRPARGEIVRRIQLQASTAHCSLPGTDPCLAGCA